MNLTLLEWVKTELKRKRYELNKISFNKIIIKTNLKILKVANKCNSSTNT
jgi:hypothetical protein